MTKFVDTHSHIYGPEFDEDFEETVARAKTAGVAALVFPGIDTTYYGRLVERSSKFPGYAFPCIGLHPTSVGEDWEKEMQFVRDHIDERKYFAIGEIGLDGHWSTEFMEQQKKVFREQMIMAYERNMPVIIHARDATEALYEVLDSLKGIVLHGTFHAFSGSFETYRRLSGYGDFYFGIGGVLTYKNSTLPETAAKMPLDRLLLETDSPYLTPVPHRGERNESSYIPIIAERLALAKGMGINEIADITTSNAEKLFGIDIQTG
ncbi:MAG: TatD family hydrolase [Bacteroidales bacterium]|jgi:TatD DNase family protein|nr:TatD family hydrolase [Bacteroidales bacterium]MCI2121300.1 TatD family hydrolase [Bacteroidales bacterium]MCI2145210.1 TatD family hydrolase [Bacteroidales bacterium]